MGSTKGASSSSSTSTPWSSSNPLPSSPVAGTGEDSLEAFEAIMAREGAEIWAKRSDESADEWEFERLISFLIMAPKATVLHEQIVRFVSSWTHQGGRNQCDRALADTSL